MADDILPLAEGFPSPGPDGWRALAEAALKGAPLDRLTRTTADGIARGPLFAREDAPAPETIGAPGAAPFVRGVGATRDPYLPWHIRQIVDHPDPKAANAAALEELEGGASALMLRLDPTGETGVAVRTLDELKTVLDGVMLGLAPLHLAPTRTAPQYAALFAAFLEQSELDPEQVSGGFGVSPVGQKSLAGGGAADLEARLARAAEAAAWAAERFAKIRTIAVTASAPHEAGGSEAQELAFACAGGASYMRTFIDHGLSADAAAGALEFTLAVDADVHLSIAKLRAARRLWARVCEAFGVSEDKRAMALHVITSRRMLTARDVWTNLIRNACAGFAAAAGGADAITVQPFTAALGPATPLARRTARNLQILLMEESHLGRVADPAGGGFLHETLAERLAEAAWAEFQEIERRGGLFEAVRAGVVQERIAKVREQRIQALSLGKDAVIGVSEYPQLDAAEAHVEARDYAPPALDAPALEPQAFAAKVEKAKAGAQIRPLATPQPEWAKLSPVRLSEPFEALRERADAFSERTGHRPRAFLATIGTLARFNARAGFATNRLAAAGIGTLAPEVHEDAAACAGAFKAAVREKAARLVVICGADADYEAHGAQYAAALRAAGADHVWLAGRPGETEHALREAGVDHFTHMRSDALAELAKALTALGA